MFDNEVQSGKDRGGVIHVGDIKGVAVERINGRAFVDVNVGDAQLDALFKIAIGIGGPELVAFRGTTPFGGVRA